jgi:hypothetical protein
LEGQMDEHERRRTNEIQKQVARPVSAQRIACLLFYQSLPYPTWRGFLFFIFLKNTYPSLKVIHDTLRLPLYNILLSYEQIHCKTDCTRRPFRRPCLPSSFLFVESSVVLLPHGGFIPIHFLVQVWTRCWTCLLHGLRR